MQYKFCNNVKLLIPFATVAYTAATFWTTAIDTTLVILNIHHLSKYTVTIHHVTGTRFQLMKVNLQQTQE